ncbi:MAG TPA: arylamine N-acetyltransferase [Pseudonocardia sp.]|nr:arylamine N-acetyltransferase [Pseudonocardia sp.]
MTTTVTSRPDWQVELFDLDAYLHRIGQPAAPPSASTLRELARAHVRTIPFENVDVVLGRHRGLAPGAITDKLVRRTRGGYCFEHALLFAAAAAGLGYPVRRLLSRVQPHRAGARTHMTLLVGADNTDHLVDVGFGAGMIEPIPLRDAAEVDQAGWLHRLESRGEEWTLLRRTDDGWTPQHAFTLEPARPIDYEVAHHYVSTHPKSPFVGNLVVMRLAEGLSRRLVGDQLTVEHADGPTVTTTVAPDDLNRTLRELDVELTEPELSDLLGRPWRHGAR